MKSSMSSARAVAWASSLEVAKKRRSESTPRECIRTACRVALASSQRHRSGSGRRIGRPQQHALYLRPEPHGQGSLRPTCRSTRKGRSSPSASGLGGRPARRNSASERSASPRSCDQLGQQGQAGGIVGLDAQPGLQVRLDGRSVAGRIGPDRPQVLDARPGSLRRPPRPPRPTRPARAAPAPIARASPAPPAAERSGRGRCPPSSRAAAPASRGRRAPSSVAAIQACQASSAWRAAWRQQLSAPVSSWSRWRRRACSAGVCHGLPAGPTQASRTLEAGCPEQFGQRRDRDGEAGGVRAHGVDDHPMGLGSPVRRQRREGAGEGVAHRPLPRRRRGPRPRSGRAAPAHRRSGRRRGRPRRSPPASRAVRGGSPRWLPAASSSASAVRSSVPPASSTNGAGPGRPGRGRGRRPPAPARRRSAGG